MNELVISELKIGNSEVNAVDARSLHNSLGSKQDFSTWLKAKVIDNPFFMENQDYVLLNNVGEQNGEVFHKSMGNPKGGRPRKDYALTIDTGKKVAMAEQTPTGDKVRDYFLECEQVAIQPQFQIPKTLHGALRLAADQAEQILQLEGDALENAPKVDLANAISASPRSLKIGDYVKAISKSTGFIIGRNNFFKWLKFEQIVNGRCSPYQRYIDNGWFEVKESTYEHQNTNGPQTCFTTLITGRGQVSVLDRFKKSEHFLMFLNKKGKGAA